MKKKISLVILVTMMTTLVACGNDTNSNATNSSTSQDDKNELTSSEIEKETEKEAEKETEEETPAGKDLLEGVTNELTCNLKENYIGELKDRTNEISFIIPSLDLTHHTVFTYNLGDKNPALVRADDEYEIFGYICSGVSKSYNEESRRFFVSVDEAVKLPEDSGYAGDGSVSFTLLYDKDKNDFSSLENFKAYFSKEAGIDSSWEYNGYYILPEKTTGWGSAEMYDYYIYKPSEFDGEVIRLKFSHYSTEIVKEYVEKCIDNIMDIDYVSSVDEFDKTKCYLEDAIANIINLRSGLIIDKPYNLVYSTYGHMALATMYDSSIYVCDIKIQQEKDVTVENIVGKYNDFLVHSNDNSLYLSKYAGLLGFYKEPCYGTFYINARYFGSTGASWKYLPVEELKKIFFGIN